jgi:hypothetical protein
MISREIRHLPYRNQVVQRLLFNEVVRAAVP